MYILTNGIFKDYTHYYYRMRSSIALEWQTLNLQVAGSSPVAFNSYSYNFKFA